jgi:hypothetical protein
VDGRVKPGHDEKRIDSVDQQDRFLARRANVPRLPRLISLPNQNYILAIPSHTEGRFAIVTDVGGGMRWTRMVLLTRALDADGEVVWS